MSLTGIDPVVRVRYVLSSGTVRYGTAFFVTAWSQSLITAAHVLEASSAGPATAIWLDSDDGEKEVSLMATSYAYPRDFARVGLDFGIIRVGAPIAVSRALSMMDDAPPFDGETLGCPEALAGSPTAQARVSVGAFEVTLGSNLLTYKRDRAAPGMSGGPVVSTSNVYGVYVGAGYATDRALECATPLDGGVLQACRNAAASPFGRCS